MSFWKLLSGFAAIGASAGIIYKAGELNGKEKYFNEGEKAGYEKGVAENAHEIEKLKIRIEEMGSKLKSFRDYEKLLIAMFAIGVSAANSDGYISPEEKEAIDSFITCPAHTKLPQVTKTYINLLYKTPPTLERAMQFITTYDKKEWDIFEYIIKMVIEADNVIDIKEVEFLKSWNNYKNAA